ncbi:hypothetical protein [Amycolatopsis vastitatis]|uniref:Uncharacterized protein n=1 Tax=Amycolatopsis vastitatis TaxID=1905142 RepID=A0A229SNY3_9PSEU|nr:hypothetical protein [Amycolatopsis vastitatis]OXM60494.1 hypothetical protein CF165_42490 [Amycolatopsis vastitatis]
MEKLERYVVMIETAIKKSRAAQDADLLFGDPIEEAVSRITNSVHAQQSASVIAPLFSVARLHYARARVGPHKPDQYLWSAATLFRMLRHAPHLPGRIPEDIIRILDAMAAEDPTKVPTLDDPYLAADTAIDLLRFVSVEPEVSVVSAAETLLRAASKRVPATDYRHSRILVGLLQALNMRLEMIGDDVGDEIAVLAERIAGSRGRSDPYWPTLLANAGSACSVAASRSGDVDLLDRAVAHLEEAVEMMPDDLPEKAGFLVNLGRAEMTRWALRGAGGWPEAARVRLQQASTLTNPDVADLPAWLATAYLAGDNVDITEARRCLEQAGDHADPGLLGETWLLLYRLGPHEADALDRAVTLLTRAVQGRARPGVRDHGESLAEGLWTRWEQARNLDDIDQVIDHLAQRVEAADTPPIVLNLLARSLRARWERTGDSVAVRHAITCLIRVVDGPDDHGPATAMYLNNLASMYQRLFSVTSEASALEEAVRRAEQAMELATADDRNRPMYANTAATCHLARWRLAGDDTDLRQATRFVRIAAAAKKHPEHVSFLGNLGVVAWQAAVHLGIPELLEEAVTALESVITAVDPTDARYGGMLLNLGQALLARGDVTRGRELLRQSVEHPHLREQDTILAARLWADQAAEAEAWGPAAASLTGAVERLAGLPGHRLDRFDHERLLIRLSGLATDAAAANLNASDPATAVQVLEAGRGVLLANALLDDRALSRVEERNPDLAERVRSVKLRLTDDVGL